VKLLQGDLAEAWREGSTDYATVAMKYALRDSMVERASGRPVETRAASCTLVAALRKACSLGPPTATPGFVEWVAKNPIRPGRRSGSARAALERTTASPICKPRSRPERRYEAARYLRTARVQFESRYHWDNFYHVGGLEREVAREIWSKRSEQEMFECLAWLYDGFALPQSAPIEK